MSRIDEWNCSLKCHASSCIRWQDSWLLLINLRYIICQTLLHSLFIWLNIQTMICHDRIVWFDISKDSRLHSHVNSCWIRQSILNVTIVRDRRNRYRWELIRDERWKWQNKFFNSWEYRVYMLDHSFFREFYKTRCAKLTT